MSNGPSSHRPSVAPHAPVRSTHVWHRLTRYPPPRNGRIHELAGRALSCKYIAWQRTTQRRQPLSLLPTTDSARTHDRVRSHERVERLRYLFHHQRGASSKAGDQPLTLGGFRMYLPQI